MGKPQVVDQNISMPLNEMDKDAYYSIVLDLKEKTLSINIQRLENNVLSKNTNFRFKKTDI